MNSERRHELQQNDLADFLGRQLKKIEPYSKLIAAVVAVAAIGLVILGFTRSAALGARSDATLELLQNVASNDAESLASVGERYAATEAGMWARLYQADALLATGVASLFNDRGEAESNLDEALKQYRAVAAAARHTLLQSRANLGAARTLESQGKLEEAIESYQRVVQIGESPQIATYAEQRIAQLERPASQQFLTWFESQDFSPPEPTAPPELPSDFTLPDIPDLTLPEVSPLALPPADAAAAPESSDGDAEATGDAAAAEQPIDQPTTAEQPASEETPAATEEMPAASETPQAGDAAAETDAAAAEEEPAAADEPAAEAEEAAAAS